MDIEIENKNRNKVWTLVPRNEVQSKIITGKWTQKGSSDGQLKAM